MKDIPYSWAGGINIVKMSIPLKVIHDLKHSLSKFKKAEKTILKFTQNLRRQNRQSNLKKEEKSWRSHIY